MPSQVTCKCGKQYKFRDEYAGRRVKCPGCGQVIMIPGRCPADMPPNSQKPPPAPASSAKTNSRKILLLSGAGAGAVLAAALGALLWFYVFGGSSSPDVGAKPSVTSPSATKEARTASAGTSGKTSSPPAPAAPEAKPPPPPEATVTDAKWHGALTVYPPRPTSNLVQASQSSAAPKREVLMESTITWSRPLVTRLAWPSHPKWRGESDAPPPPESMAFVVAPNNSGMMLLTVGIEVARAAPLPKVMDLRKIKLVNATGQAFPPAGLDVFTSVVTGPAPAGFGVPLATEPIGLLRPNGRLVLTRVENAHSAKAFVGVGGTVIRFLLDTLNLEGKPDLYRMECTGIGIQDVNGSEVEMNLGSDKAELTLVKPPVRMALTFVVPLSAARDLRLIGVVAQPLAVKP